MEIEITDKVMLINIPKSYKELMKKHNISEKSVPELCPEELYDATRAAWRVELNRAQNYKIVFCVYKEKVREIYKVERWEKAIDKVHPLDKSEEGNRIRFVGKVSDDIKLREKYLRADTSKHFYRGQRNPIVYANYKLKIY